jgi:hypothetical protein
VHIDYYRATGEHATSMNAALRVTVLGTRRNLRPERHMCPNRRMQAEAIKAKETVKIRAGESSVKHVEIFRMGV